MSGIGSTWSRWDLHVHTPASFEHSYPGDGSEAWDAFLDDLERLPSEVTVVGINDYLEVAGYRRVLEERSRGRLQNLRLILPVVEFRVARFAGHAQWQRVNFHVIFSDEVAPDAIEQEFLTSIRSSYMIREGDEWSGPPLRPRLEELGRRLRAVSPTQTSPVSDLKLGVDNFNIEPAEIRQLLEGADIFRGRYLTAIGKAEWDQLAWSAGSIAEKRSIIESVDFVFTACETQAGFESSRRKLEENTVQSRLLHCSDAHSLSSSTAVNRVGQSLTWIKALPTFDGLLIARHEYEQRIFVGAEPPDLQAVREAPTKYLATVAFERTREGEGPWFDGANVDLNPGLVAIIGNKGSGKSALTDATALAVDADVEDHLSFLSDKRFRNPRSGQAEEFKCHVTWRSGDIESKGLTESVRQDRPERVRYLPQNYFEQLCSDVGEEAYADFEAELKQVVFSWLPLDRQLGKSSLDELIEATTGEARERRRLLAREMTDLNRQTAKVERTLQPSAVRELEGRIAERKRELQAHDANKPPDEPELSGQVSAEDEAALREADELDSRIQATVTKQTASAGALAHHRLVQQAVRDTTARIDNVKLYVAQELDSAEAADAFRLAGMRREDLLTVTINPDVLRERTEQVFADAASAEEQLQDFVQQLAELEANKRALLERLDSKRQEMRSRKASRERWQSQRVELVGDLAKEGSLTSLEAELAAMPERVRELRALEERRVQLFDAIFNELASLRDMYRSMFAPVQDYLSQEPLLSEGLTMSVDALIRSDEFASRFLSHVDQSKSGSFFRGGEETVKRLIDQTDFDSAESAQQFVMEVSGLLRPIDNDGRPTEDVDRQLRGRSTREEAYDLLFGLDYLSPHYALKFNAKEIAQLSPGERGAALLIFYLLVDQSNVPILLDQPEENLDNETVTTLLVPAIRAARKRRQVILVTHNPNLAVYCDADQIILAELERTPQAKIRYRSGAIEERETRTWLINILEGTGRAFGKRHAKYSIGAEGQLVFESS